MNQLEEFTEELHQWSLEGKEPVNAARGLRYLLEQQEQRLKSLGIEREEEYVHVKDEIRGALDRKGSGFTSKIIYREARQNLTYRKDGKVIRKYSRPVNLYVSFLDKDDYQDGLCTCPNCGNTMKRTQAREGCPYCGTHFEMDEIYPCAAYYYTVPGIAERGTLMENIKREVMTAGIIGGLLTAAVCFFGWQDTPAVWRIFGALLMGVLYGGVAAFVWYMIRSLILAGKVFYEAGRAMPMMKALNSRKKMTAFMQENEPEFSYEEFEGKVLSLLRSVAFEHDRESLCFYEGKDDLSAFDKAADMQYRGALYIRKHEKDGDLLRVQGTAFLTDTYAGRTVSEKDEQFRFTVEKKIDRNFDPGFTFLKVACSSCNGSFDAVHQRYCPYCGHEYELRRKDWVLTELKRK